MEAGRELDALVAEKVMGWSFTPKDGGTLVTHPHGQFLARLAENIISFTDNVGIPHYSTDIAAAWEVVERLKQDGFSFALEYGAGEGALAVFVKGDFIGDDLAGPGAEFGKTAPHAVCLAALKTKGVEL